MESNVKVPFVTSKQLGNLTTSSQNRNLDAIDEINRAKALLNLIISSADEHGIGQAAESAIAYLTKATEILDRPDEAVDRAKVEDTEVDTQRKPKELTRHDFLNPRFMPDHVDEGFYERTRTSGLAGDLWAVISTAENALDSCSGVPIGNRGIGTTLQIATHMASDLVERCETLEWELSQAKKRNHYTGEANEAA